MAYRSGQVVVSWRLMATAVLMLGLGAGLIVTSRPVAAQREPPVQGSDVAISKQDLNAIEQKLDQVLENQEQIFSRFDEVMKELGIVKIRATIRR